MSWGKLRTKLRKERLAEQYWRQSQSPVAFSTGVIGALKRVRPANDGVVEAEGGDQPIANCNDLTNARNELTSGQPAGQPPGLKGIVHFYPLEQCGPQ